jgi:hypothetical protein
MVGDVVRGWRLEAGGWIFLIGMRGGGLGLLVRRKSG